MFAEVGGNPRPDSLPSFDDIRLADGSHLNRASARRYSRDFWQRFVALPEVRQRLQLEGAAEREDG